MIFHPQPLRLPVLLLSLVQKENSLLRKPDSPYEGSESPNCSGSSSCPDQVLLSKNSIQDLVADRESLVRSSGVGGVKIGFSVQTFTQVLLLPLFETPTGPPDPQSPKTPQHQKKKIPKTLKSSRIP